MNFKIILLGLIQGFTEFLPVSSSGHLALAQIFLGIEVPPLSYDLTLHVATSLATIFFFLPDIISLLMEWLSGFRSADGRVSSGWMTGWAVIVATAITGVIGFLLKDFSEIAMMNSVLVGLGLMFTGVVLISSKFLKLGVAGVRPTDGIWVGIAQGIAVLPGVSRSGMTIMAATSAGLAREEAFRFSFLVSLPAIFGATLLQMKEVGGWHTFITSLPDSWFIGVVVAFISGLLALALLKRIVIAAKWWLFGIYCLITGSVSVLVSYLGAW